MKVVFIASMSIITPDPDEEARIFEEGLGLPLTVAGDYRFSEDIKGAKHFGVWPLVEAARACFGAELWPTDRPVPQASIEFDVDDVEAAVQELQDKGLELLHPARTEPWGQTIARLQAPSGVIVGVSHTPWMRTEEDQGGLLGWPTWVGVVADDLERQRRFWGQLLGLPEHHSGTDFVHFTFPTGESFEVIERSADPQYDRPRFQVGFEVDDIELAREELIRRGVEPISDVFADETSPWAYFRDPEGNVFEIKQRAVRRPE